MTMFDATIFTHLADHLNEGKKNPTVISMREMMANMWGVDIDSLPTEPAQAIITNKEGMFGAVNIYNEDCIKQVQEILKTKNFYVLPSSIHEVICVPTEGIEIDDLLTMVAEINSVQVKPEEQLGNFVLYYDGDTRQMVKITEK